MTLSIDSVSDRWMVEFELCLDCSTNFTDYGHMIPLFLVTLFAIVVFASIVLQPSRPARGEEPTVQNDPVIHRTDFEQAWSTQVDYRPQASALLGAGRDAVGSLLGLQFRTTRFGTNSGSLDPYSLKRAKNTV